MENIVIAGAGVTGANIAYQLALRGARGVVLADRGAVASGSTGRALGGVRQQFSTPLEVAMVQESVEFFLQLGPRYFQQFGYMFFATTDRGMAELDARRETQLTLGVPVERAGRARIERLAPGIDTNDILGGVFCAKDGLADPLAITLEWIKRAAALGVEVRERVDPMAISARTRVICSGAYSVAMARRAGVELPIRPLVRQLIQTTPIQQLPESLPMLIEAETGFHFRRKNNYILIAMGDAAPRYQFEESVDESVIPDRLARLARRYPPASGARAERAWAALYDMTPDAHPILGRVADGLFVACGFSGHGFMVSPAVGRALAEEILYGSSSLDISSFRYERFAAGAHFGDEIVL